MVSQGLIGDLSHHRKVVVLVSFGKFSKVDLVIDPYSYISSNSNRDIKEIWMRHNTIEYEEVGIPLWGDHYRTKEGHGFVIRGSSGACPLMSSTWDATSSMGGGI